MTEKKININMDWYKSEFQRFEAGLNGQSKTPIHKIRQDAMNHFVNIGFPTTRVEEWKYTNVKPIADTNFNLAHEYEKGLVTKEEIRNLSYCDMDCYKIVFVNGHYSDEFSTISGIEKKLTVTNLRNAFDSNNIEVSSKITKFANYKDDAFTALSTAFMQNGALIHIKEGAVISKPIFLLFVTAGQENRILSHPRNLIIADPNCEATIIESFVGKDVKNYFSNVVTELIVKSNSKIEHIKIQNESDSAFHISTLFAHQDANSRFRSFDINLGGKIVRNNIFAVLDGLNAECTLDGVYVGNKNQHIDNRTVIEHTKPQCTSFEVYKGIMNDQARGVFNGKIHVHSAAQKTNAEQSNSGLLLSNDASIDAKPHLEIYADDVRCTHGTTIGQLDKDALFYLQSRAIGYNEARNMLIHSFAGEVLDKIKNDNIREEIENQIYNKLNLMSSDILK